MRAGSGSLARGVAGVLSLWLACVGGEERSDAEAARTLRPVPIPDLESFPESVQEQLRAEHVRVQALADRSDTDARTLGAAYGALGKQLLAYELDEAAEAALSNAAELAPEEVRWPYYLGHVHQEAGRLERAAEHYERALALQPDDVPTRVHLATVYADLGREADARALLREAVRIDPQSAVAHLLLGDLAAAENPSEAVEHYEAVLRLQPQASMAHYPLALAYRRVGDLERSREHLSQRGQTRPRLSDPWLEELSGLRKGAGALIERGNELMKQQRYAEAIESYERAVREDSTIAMAFLNLAVAAAQVGETEKAVHALERTLRLDPANSAAHFNLGVLALLSGEPGKEEKAIAHFRAAVETNPRSNSARLALADLLWRGRRCREAIAHYDTFLTARSDYVYPRIRKGVCHARLGEHARARAALETGLEVSPDEPSLRDALVRILAASPDPGVRDGERALAMARRLVGERPGPETVEGLAMALAELGRSGEAVQYQRQVVRAAEESDVPEGLLNYLRENLRRYERGEPCRTPWPPTVFDR